MSRGQAEAKLSCWILSWCSFHPGQCHQGPRRPRGPAPRGVAAGERSCPSLGSVKRGHFITQTPATPEAGQAGGSLGRPRGQMPSPGEALGRAGPRDPLCVRRPGVIAQLPHVLGHHVEEESDEALGADAGH